MGPEIGLSMKILLPFSNPSMQFPSAKSRRVLPHFAYLPVGEAKHAELVDTRLCEAKCTFFTSMCMGNSGNKSKLVVANFVIFIY